MSIEIVLRIIGVPGVLDEGYRKGIHFKSSLRTLVPSLQVGESPKAIIGLLGNSDPLSPT